MGGRGRIKRQQVSADDGWTVITHGLSNLSVGGKEGKKGRISNHAQNAGSLPTDTVEGLTAEKLLEDFNRRTERWKDTACAQYLEDLLLKRKWGVSEAVCIGIGSFSRDWEHRHRAMWQLVLFMSVVQHLQKEGSEVKLYAQEPAFTPLDHAFLSLLSISICTDDISTHIIPRSFVFSPFVDWYILLPIFLRDREPILYVGNEILDDYGAFAQSEEKRARLEECNELGKAFLEKRDMVKLKEFEGHAHALNGMVVYWMEDGDEEDGVDAKRDGADKDEAQREVYDRRDEVKTLDTNKGVETGDEENEKNEQ